MDQEGREEGAGQPDCDGLSDEAKDYMYPRRRRDKKRLCGDIDLGDAKSQRLVYDPLGRFRDDFLKPCPALERAERELWTMLLGGLRSEDPDEAGSMRRAFNVTPQFMKIVRSVPDDLFNANSGALVETEFLSFAPTLQFQMQIASSFAGGAVSPRKWGSVDLNKSTAALRLWTLYAQIVSSDMGFHTMALRCGLTDALMADLAAYGGDSVARAAASVSVSPFSLKLRCTEAVAVSILLAESPRKLEGLLFLKWAQICSGNEAEREAIKRKLDAGERA